MKSAGLTSRTLRRLFESLFTSDYEDQLVDYLPKSVLANRDLPDLSSSIRSLHFPESESNLDRARYRMKYEELFFFQLGLGLRKGARERELAGRELSVRSELASQLRGSLPFELTGAQKRVLHEILDDLVSGKSMSRLLQGDVGVWKDNRGAVSSVGSSRQRHAGGAHGSNRDSRRTTLSGRFEVC